MKKIKVVDNGGYWIEDTSQRVDCPVLLFGSKEDSFITNIEEDFKLLTNQIQDCRFALSEKGDHPLLWTNTKFFNAEVMKFLNDYKKYTTT